MGKTILEKCVKTIGRLLCNIIVKLYDNTVGTILVRIIEKVLIINIRTILL